jgi:hypothetical protein
MMQIEQHDQIIVANWLTEHGIFYTIAPSGMKLPIGVAKRLKAMGYRAGTPDLMIFEPRNIYHGLFVEMKRPAILGKDQGRVSQKQKEFGDEAIKKNYVFIVCWGSDDAITQIDRYLNL